MVLKRERGKAQRDKEWERGESGEKKGERRIRGEKRREENHGRKKGEGRW